MNQMDFLQRTRSLIGDREIEALSKPLVAISGLGGVGGAAFMTILRSGVRRFRLAENGIFDPPDMNRQWGAIGSTMDRPKIEVYAEWASGINPDAELELYPDGIDLKNISDFLDGADIYIGAIDVDKGKEVKDESNRICRDAKTPTFTCGAFGFGALMVNYDPEGMPADEFWSLVASKSSGGGLFPSYMTRYFSPALIDNLAASTSTGKLATCSVGAGQAGLLLGSEVITHILRETEYVGREIIFAPKFVAVDLLEMRLIVEDVTK